MEQEQNNPEPLLPAEFVHLEAPLRTAQQQLTIINKQIENVPKDKGARPGLLPPDYYHDARSAGDRHKTLTGLNDQKAKVIAAYNKLVDKELVNSNPKTAKNLRETVKFHLSDYRYATMTRAEIATDKKVPKSLDQSQDHAFKKISDHRASDRFTRSLNYTTELQKVEISDQNTLQKTLDIKVEIDKD